jgi:prepilin-type N-terminal cleavage/methylation domain-containing protein
MKTIDNRKTGFTLVEIMFVVAIIGLLAAIGVPSILNAMAKAQEKTRTAHITSIEKAKSMLILPALVYAHGQSLESGDKFGEGNYTEENLMACIQNVDDLDDLTVGKYRLIPGDIGTKATYSETAPSESP